MAGLLSIGRRHVPLGHRLCIEWDIMTGSLAIGRRGVPLGDRLCVEWDITARSLGVRRHVVPLDDRLGLAVRCMGHHGVLTRNSSPLCSAGLSVPSRRRPSEHHGMLYPQVVAAMSRSVSSSASLRVEWGIAAGLLAIDRRDVPLGDRLCVEWDIMTGSLAVRRRRVPLGERLCVKWDITARSLGVRRHVLPLDDRLGLAVRCMGHHAGSLAIGCRDVPLGDRLCVEWGQRGGLTLGSPPPCPAGWSARLRCALRRKSRRAHLRFVATLFAGLSVPSRRRPSEHHGVLYPQVVAARSPSVSSSASLRVERDTTAGLFAIGRRHVPSGDRLCIEWDIMAGSLGVRRYVVPLGDRLGFAVRRVGRHGVLTRCVSQRRSAR